MTTIARNSLENTDTPTIVLLPGIISSSKYWRQVVAELDGKVRVVSFDLLGFCDAPKPLASSYSLDEHVEYVLSVLRQSKLPSQFVLVGHSFGAMIALRIAARKDARISKLVLSGLPLVSEQGYEQLAKISRSPTQILHGLTGWINAGVIYALGPIVRTFIHKLFTDMPDYVIRDTTRTVPWALMRSIDTMIHYDPSQDFAANTVPTTLVFGMADSIGGDPRKELMHLAKNYTISVLDCDHQIPLRKPGYFKDILL
jgi:pimeloyl-ACP methyl ester carboxylesterase